MPKPTNPLRRKSSTPSPFSTLQRKKSGVQRKAALEKEAASESLIDVGNVPSLAPRAVQQDVTSLIQYIKEHTWEEIPEVAGMGSERISEVLNFRKNLPPIVSTAHLHALSKSSTDTERELARLIATGTIRKVTIPGRGKGGAAIGEGVALVEDWKALVDSSERLEDETKATYIALMNAHPASSTAPTTSLDQAEITALVRAGLLTNPAAISDAGSLFAPLGSSTLSPLSSAGHTAPTGSLAAIGGQGAIHESGGGGSTLSTIPTRDNRPAHNKLTQHMTFSLPGMGAYLQLLTAARLHLIYLLKQISPRYKECTIDVLREKWEGNTLGDATSKLKRARGEWSGVLPGKTRKWREFSGMAFDWILAECVGSGLIELFDTGAVGNAVRAR